MGIANRVPRAIERRLIGGDIRLGNLVILLGPIHLDLAHQPGPLLLYPQQSLVLAIGPGPIGDGALQFALHLTLLNLKVPRVDASDQTTGGNPGPHTDRKLDQWTRNSKRQIDLLSGPGPARKTAPRQVLKRPHFHDPNRPHRLSLGGFLLLTGRKQQKRTQ